jgi:glycerol uptake facilitator-like aquaporin
VSGAHLNPAVTLSFAVRREIGAALAVGYVLAQVTGAVLGTWAAHVMLDESVLQLSTKARTGSGLWFAEAVATFGLILTILGTQRWKSWAENYHLFILGVLSFWFLPIRRCSTPLKMLIKKA